MIVYYLVRPFTQRIVGVTYSLSKARDFAKKYGISHHAKVNITKVIESYSYGYKD